MVCALAQEYLHELDVVRQVSSHTLAAYQRDLQILIGRLEESATMYDKVDTDKVRLWVAKLHSAGRSPRSIARTLSAWRGFYDWLANVKKLVSSNPFKDVKAPRRNKPLPKALSVEDALRLVDGASSEKGAVNDFESLRDSAIVELLYSSGLRLSELLGIDIYPVNSKEYSSAGWLDLKNAEVMVLGKGKKRRTVPVGSAAIAALEKWLEISATYRQPIENLAYAGLFINRQGKRLSARTVQKHLARLAITAGLPTHVHPHMLRHSFASHVLQSSGDLRAVQEMLGHASIASTQIYTALDFQHLAHAYDQAHPRAKNKKGS
jgi:integrase/recombinase XerC